MIVPGQTLAVEFTLRNPTTGVAADADSTPTGTLVRNGIDTAVSVTVTRKATGSYKASVVIPGSYVAGDIVQVLIDATVAGISDRFPVWGQSLATLGDVDGFTSEEASRLILAALAGQLSGAATNSVVIKAADGSKTRITATVDEDGNRSSLTLDAT